MIVNLVSVVVFLFHPSMGWCQGCLVRPRLNLPTPTASLKNFHDIFVITDVPVNGGWCPWTDWGLCSVTCGNGYKMRSRTCTSPVPQYGGSDCYGSGTETMSCNLRACHCEYKLIHILGACHCEYKLIHILGACHCEYKLIHILGACHCEYKLIHIIGACHCEYKLIHIQE